ncbi:hemolymph lipopolysaccharide-binding protein-like [Periplaneta americana]|uniref:hemolymph lipopolysaccharide-binding protein-like n=1 Tax=Periplaneta americana TaxID=6978 RepID=UPI0037E75CEE
MWLYALWCAGIFSFAASQCNETSDLQFSITSRLNHTGHWIAQVNLDQKTRKGMRNLEPVDVNVTKSTTTCEGIEVFKISATISVPSKQQTSLGRIPSPGYELIQGFGYYKMHVTNKTWNEAYHFCELEGAHLLVLNSEEEANALKRLWVKHPGKPGGWNWAYVGFHCLFNEGKFVTLFNQPLTEAGYNKWYPGHPGASPSRFCGIVHDSMLLGDTICNDHLAFICELEI